MLTHPNHHYKVLLVQCYQVEAAKRKREPYSVQEVSHDFDNGGGTGGFAFAGSDSLAAGGGHLLKGGFGGGIGGGFGGGSGGFIAPHFAGGLSHFGGHDSGSDEESYGGHDDGDDSGSDSHGNEDDSAHYKIKTLLLEAKLNQKLAAEKVEKMLKSFGHGTFGYPGYEYPIKPVPIDLGTHHGVDLGVTLDSHSTNDPHGKIKLPVQTVLITNTLGVPIPEPYPVKHEVPVPAPYPVPVPVHTNHYSSESYPSSDYSSDYSDDYGKSSYAGSESGLSKVVSYHENLPKATEKLYTSASTTYAKYLPSQASFSGSAYRSLGSPSVYSSAPKTSVYEF